MSQMHTLYAITHSLYSGRARTSNVTPTCWAGRITWKSGFNLKTAVGSRKSAQALDVPGTMKKRSSPIR
jgi:hypothetical protein